MGTLWRIEMLGGLRLMQGERLITRFKSTRNGALLAHLAYHPRPHFREAIIDLFWPDAEIEAARNSFRVALNSLRRQLEPPGVTPGSVLLADRMQVSLAAAAVATDVWDFEAAIRRAQREPEAAGRRDCLAAAVDLYRGELLAGWNDDWIEPERARIADLYLGALRQLTHLHVELKELDRAIECAHRAVIADPYREEAHRHLMSLYSATGRPAAAMEQFNAMERILRDELGVAPSQTARELASRISARMGRLPDRHVAEDALPAASPAHRPSAPPAAATGSVPVPPTRFFGRDDEIAALRQLLAPEDGARLVTLTGPSGSGKTRLAIEAARRLQSARGGRAWVVDLGSVQSADGIVPAIAEAMRVQIAPDAGVAESVQGALAEAPALLVLDNFEQVVEAGAPVVEALLSAVGDLQCLVTSQVRLGIAGEREVPVEPLPPPPPEESQPDALLACPSVALFVDRAQAARPDFQLTARNAAAVADLCRGLEGLPLALELAAAWAQVMTAARMAEKLSDRFDLLVSPRRGGSDRRRALRSALDWSFDLLEEDLQRFLVRLGCFSGGCTVEAASAVCQEPDAAHMLWGLSQRSLVRAVENEDGMRFTMLATIRDYARQRTGEVEAARLREAHARWFAGLVHEASAELTGAAAAAWLDRLDADHANVRAAHDTLLGSDAGAALKMAADLWPYWYARGLARAGRERVSASLAAVSSPPGGVAAAAMYGAGRMAAATGDHGAACVLFADVVRQAVAAGDNGMARRARAGLWHAARAAGDAGLEQEVAIARIAGLLAPEDALLRAQALASAATGAGVRGDHAEARRLGEECVGAMRTLGDRPGEADALEELAAACEACGDHAAAERCREQATGDAPSPSGSRIAGSYLGLAALAAEQGDLPEARRLAEEALAMLRASGAGMEIALGLTADIALLQADWPAARAALLEWAGSPRVRQDALAAAGVLFAFARLAAGAGRGELAARLAGAAGAATGDPAAWERTRVAPALRAMLPEDRLAGGVAAGTALSPEAALASAVAISA